MDGTDARQIARRGHPSLAAILGQSRLIEAVKRQIIQLAPAPVPVLILGETGTGKELCARALSELSGREPFVPVNCGAIPESLAESEFFGHAKGAFTGADRERGGLVRASSGGTLFLDELTEIPLSLQAKLLRVLESGEYRPVGTSKVRMADLRIVAATNGDVASAVKAGSLRKDLLFRLGVARISLPPLRERPEDIPLLAEAFLSRLRRKDGMRVPDRLSAGAVERLLEHSWHGNVRELKHILEAAAYLAVPSDTLDPAHLEGLLRADTTDPSDTLSFSLSDARDNAEVAAIRRALRLAGGNRADAAELLGISEATLYRKLSQYGG